MRNDVMDDKELEDELLDLVASEGLIERDRLHPDALLADLDIASADFIMVLMAIEEKYDAYIPVDNEISELRSVQDLLNVACKKIGEARSVSQAAAQPE